MMCCMTQCQFSTGRTDKHGTEEPMVTDIQANMTLRVGRGGVRALDKDLRCGRGDPLAFGNLDMDNIFVIYGGGRRGGGT